jgi:hypothetical protein
MVDCAIDMLRDGAAGERWLSRVDDRVAERAGGRGASGVNRQSIIKVWIAERLERGTSAA